MPYLVTALIVQCVPANILWKIAAHSIAFGRLEDLPIRQSRADN